MHVFDGTVMNYSSNWLKKCTVALYIYAKGKDHAQYLLNTVISYFDWKESCMVYCTFTHVVCCTQV